MLLFRRGGQRGRRQENTKLTILMLTFPFTLERKLAQFFLILSSALLPLVNEARNIRIDF